MKAIVPALTALALLLLAAPAQGDVGFESASRHAGSPGDRVELTIGCGFCFPPCVGALGHRHPPGDRHGGCMLGNRAGPPASFPVWLTPLRHSLDPYMCDLGERCTLGARPPRLPSFVYLGRALPPRVPEGIAERRRYDFPRYRLIFRVPEVRPGRYKYVLFCETCVDDPRGEVIERPMMPRGSLIESPTTVAGRLRVVPPIATASGSGGGTLPWIAAGALAAILALGFAVLRHSRGTRPQAGRAA